MTPQEIDLLTKVATQMDNLIARFDRHESRVLSRLEALEETQDRATQSRNKLSLAIANLDKKIAVLNVRSGFIGAISAGVVALSAFVASWMKGMLGGS